MRVKLKWNNKNDPSVIVRLYRTDTIIPNDQLTNPIAILDPSATEYIDNAVVHGATYYYTWETDNGVDKLYSTNLKVVCLFDNGPGPTDLQWGNSLYGYFGFVNEADFIRGTELAAMLGTTPTGAANRRWHKWIRNGKIFFVPSRVIVDYTTVKDLYNAGLMFGMQGPGPWKPNGITDDVDQYRIISKFARDFIVRLPIGLGDDTPDKYSTATSNSALRRKGECADFVYPMLNNYVASTQRAPRLSYTDSCSSIFSNRVSPTSSNYNNSTIRISDYSPNNAAQIDGIYAIDSNYACTWLPILEMLQEDVVQEVNRDNLN